jgi:DNA polymerase
MAKGLDPYLLIAADLYGVPRGSLSKEKDVEKRQRGKNTFLGCGFQMGADKWCMKYQGECQCRDLPARCEHPDSLAHTQAVEGVATYRTKTAPLVPQLWYAFEEAAYDAFLTRVPRTVRGITFALEDGWMTARLFDGKKIYYWNPTTIRSRFDKDAWAYWELRDGRLQRTDVYGGKLVQNVVMGLERQLLVHAMARVEREGLRPILNGYDELVTEPEAAAADWATLKQIMEDGPQWAKDLGLPIAAEGWVGDRYRKG